MRQLNRLAFNGPAMEWGRMKKRLFDSPFFRLQVLMGHAGDSRSAFSRCCFNCQRESASHQVELPFIFPLCLFVKDPAGFVVAGRVARRRTFQFHFDLALRTIDLPSCRPSVRPAIPQQTKTRGEGPGRAESVQMPANSKTGSSCNYGWF